MKYNIIIHYTYESRWFFRRISMKITFRYPHLYMDMTNVKEAAVMSTCPVGSRKDGTEPRH